jgi:hypothetical protein
VDERIHRCISDVRALLLDDLSLIIAGRPVILVNQEAAQHVIDSYFLAAGAPSITHIRILDDQPTLTDYFREFDEELAHPARRTMDMLREVDPERKAAVYAGSPVSEPRLDQREVLGRRRKTWKRAESQENQVATLLPQEGYDVVYLSIQGPDSANRILQQAIEMRPCVLSGDPHNSIAMASDHVYFIDESISQESFADACDHLAGSCTGVRVARFTPGCPTTIYGVAVGNDVAFLGFAESLVGYNPHSGQVVAPGVLCPVDGQSQLTPQDLELARSQILRLAQGTGFRGAFGIDGTYGTNRFVSHEINTRVCGGFSLISHMLGGKVSFGVVDLVLRHPHSRRTSEVMALLSDIGRSVFKQADVCLWADRALQDELRRKAPERGCHPDQVRAWRHNVRTEVYSTTQPFFTTSTRVTGREVGHCELA